MAWLWLNLSLGAIVVAAIVGVPLWLTITRPDRVPQFSDLPGWWRSGIRRVQPVPVPVARPARQHAGEPLDPAA